MSDTVTFVGTNAVDGIPCLHFSVVAPCRETALANLHNARPDLKGKNYDLICGDKHKPNDGNYRINVFGA